MRIAFRIFRIITLLSIFVFLAFYAKTQKLKSTSWSQPLQVVIYPMNGDGSPVVEEYINQLEESVFSEIDQFFQNEARAFELSIEHPITTALGQVMLKHPPVSPAPGSSFAEIAWWGVKFRYWAFRHTPDDQSNLHRIRVFVHYHKDEKDKLLQHSLGLDKGLLAIVHAFASTDQQAQNNIIIAHELLHTVGATDKYNMNNQPVYPDGYAEPEQTPLFPQTLAEIMSAKIALSSTHSEMAENLDQCIIGEKTATEINWIQVESNT
ncbi:MAG: hypothetical protein KAT04_07795 [Methylococcales bacterium]|nr:hypothetical protein [Methylococcales bacterium]